ncbi:MAG: hypothetical protein WC558_14495, partial [Patulibacter sp.]
DEEYLRDDRRRATLIAEMCAANPSGFVFRSPQRYAPPVTMGLYVRGLKDVVESCSTSGIRIHLPKAGWLGWLAMGWGAWGFSAGLGVGTWCDQLDRAGGNSPDEPTRWYFEPQLLRAVPWRVHEDLAKRANYIPCTCVDCAGVASRGWEDLKAKRHQLRHANAEAASLSGRTTVQQRAIAIRARIDGAIAFRNSLPATLAKQADAKFLTSWGALV